MTLPGCHVHPVPISVGVHFDEGRPDCTSGKSQHPCGPSILQGQRLFDEEMSTVLQFLEHELRITVYLRPTYFYLPADANPAVSFHVDPRLICHPVESIGSRVYPDHQSLLLPKNRRDW